MTELQAELQRRWRAVFSALAGGDDVPPSRRLRAEGLMESLVLTGDFSAAELQQSMDDCYREVIGRGLAEDFGEDWRAFYPFPQIPAMGRRAPVYPSTSD